MPNFFGGPTVARTLSISGLAGLKSEMSLNERYEGCMPRRIRCRREYAAKGPTRETTGVAIARTHWEESGTWYQSAAKNGGVKSFV
jgi:hypothetical protein